MPDRHKNPPRAVRMPDGLEAWYVEEAPARGKSVNGLIIAALEDFRERCSGTTTAPVRADSGSTTPKRARSPREAPAPAARFVAAGKPQPVTASHSPNCKCGICRPKNEGQ